MIPRNESNVLDEVALSDDVSRAPSSVVVVGDHVAADASELSVLKGTTVVLVRLDGDSHALCELDGVRGKVPIECLDISEE